MAYVTRGGHPVKVSASGTRLVMAKEPTEPAPYTIRFKFSDKTLDPTTVDALQNGGTWTKSTEYYSSNVWDWTYSETPNWNNTFAGRVQPGYIGCLVAIIDSNTDGVTNMSNMFTNCTALTSVTGLETGTSTNFHQMFRGCTNLTTVNGTLDLSSATSSPTAYYMFDGCSALTAIPDIILPESTNAMVNYMFNGCVSVTEGIDDLYEQAVEKNIQSYENCFKLCGVDSSGEYASENAQEERSHVPPSWGGEDKSTNTIRIKFDQPMTLDTVPWTDDRKLVTKVDVYTYDYTVYENYVTSTSGLLAGGVSGVSAEIVSTTDLSAFTAANWMFSGNTSITKVCALDLPGVTSSSAMFAGCSSLTEVGDINLPKSTDVSSMFTSCVELTAIPTVTLSDTISINANYMFAVCTGVTSGALEAYETLSAKTNIATHADTFIGCGERTDSGIAELAQIPMDWGGQYTSATRYLRFTFSNTYDPSGIDNGGTWTQVPSIVNSNMWEWDCNDTDWTNKFMYDSGSPGYVPKVGYTTLKSYLVTDNCSDIKVTGKLTGVTNISSLFMSASGVTSVTLSDVSTLEDASYAFHYASGLTAVDMDQNTSSLVNATCMFGYCPVLPTAPMLDLTHATTISYMFLCDSKLTSIPAYDVQAVTTATEMFTYCYKVSEGMLAFYNKMKAVYGDDKSEFVFHYCGVNYSHEYASDTAREERAQIPDAWGGDLFDDAAIWLQVKITNSDAARTWITSLTQPRKIAQVSGTTDQYKLYYSATEPYVYNTFDGSSYLLEVVDSHTTDATYMNFLFKGCANLTAVNVLDTSNVYDMQDLFCDCVKLATVPQINCKSASNLQGVFCNCPLLTSIDVINTSKAYNMTGMFAGAGITTTPHIDASSATDMTRMFYQCSNLTTVDIVNTSKCTSMHWMFKSCTSLVTAPTMDTGKVQYMGSMFNGCTKLTTVPPMNTSNVTDMSYMFYTCTSLTTIPELNTSKVTNFTNMFSNATSLTTVPAMDTSLATSTQSMFYGCTALTKVGDTFNLPKATDMSYMFYTCNKLTKLPALTNVNSVTNVAYFANGARYLESGIKDAYQAFLARASYITSNKQNTFQYCGDLTYDGCKERWEVPFAWGGDYIPQSSTSVRMFMSELHGSAPSGLTSKGSVYQRSRIVYDWYPSSSYTTDWSNALGTYQGTCVGKLLSSYDPDIKVEVDATGVTTMKQMFAGCDGVTSIKLTNASSVTDMQGAFACANMSSFSVDNTSSLTNVYGMFGGQYYGTGNKLTTLSLFDTSKVTNMGGFLGNSRMLTEIPDFSVAAITQASEVTAAFYGCNKVTTGMTRMYNKMSAIIGEFPETGVEPPFKYCGIDTDGNYASDNAREERAKIPTLWGGDKESGVVGTPEITMKIDNYPEVSDSTKSTLTWSVIDGGTGEAIDMTAVNLVLTTDSADDGSYTLTSAAGKMDLYKSGDGEKDVTLSVISKASGNALASDVASLYELSDDEIYDDSDNAADGLHYNIKLSCDSDDYHIDLYDVNN